MERTEKLETMVRAGLHLRKAIEDLTPASNMLSVPREAVVQYDAQLEKVKSDAPRP